MGPGHTKSMVLTLQLAQVGRDFVANLWHRVGSIELDCTSSPANRRFPKTMD